MGRGFPTRKVYGAGRDNTCPFCGASATTTNDQKLPTCLKHKSEELYDLKCKCGDYVDLKIGRYGPFFLCMACGPQKYDLILEINGYPLKSIDDI